MQTITISHFQLATLLFSTGDAWYKLPNGRYGLIQSALRESGSGRSFILTFCLTDNTYIKVLCKIAS